METTTIHHLIPVPNKLEESNFSFFQGFSHEVMDNTHWIIESLGRFPHDVGELFLSEERYVKAKMYASPLSILMLKEDLIKPLINGMDLKFVVIWSNEFSFETSVEVCNLLKHKSIHISSIKNEKSIYVGDLSDEVVSRHLIDVAKSIVHTNKDSSFSRYIEKLISKPTRKIPEIKLGFMPINHGCTQPNLHVLISYGYWFEKFKELIPKADIEQHVDGIIQTTKEIDVIRNNSRAEGIDSKNDAIIYCPSIYTFLYKQNSDVWRELYRTLNKGQRDFIKNGIVRNKGYSNFTIRVDEKFGDIRNDKFIKSILHVRQKELNYFTLLINLLAINQFSPGIRLPNSVMLHHDKLKNIHSLIVSNSKKSLVKLNRKISLYQNELIKDIGDDLIGVCFDSRKSILFACDFPVEWLKINSLPVMFSHEVSRVPCTPGNISSQLITNGVRVVAKLETFKKILIVRSFNKSDPIKRMLESAISQFDKTGGYSNISIEWCDVSNEEELIKSLNLFDGNIVIFDCHGGHGGETSHAWLQIGDYKVDVWSLAGKARIPSIVILSACDTHPIDGSHASVAAGLLRCGALSVLGTYAPIGSIHASVFSARLLLRVSEYLPAYFELNKQPISWRKIVSGFLKMSYSTDILRGLRFNEKIINTTQYMDIHNRSNMNISIGRNDWFEKLIEDISTSASLSKDDLLDIIDSNYSYVETMLYCHLGRPENLSVME